MTSLTFLLHTACLSLSPSYNKLTVTRGKEMLQLLRSLKDQLLLRNYKSIWSQDEPSMRNWNTQVYEYSECN